MMMVPIIMVTMSMVAGVMMPEVMVLCCIVPRFFGVIEGLGGNDGLCGQ